MWDLIGGRDTVKKLTRGFYSGVVVDEVLLPMHAKQPGLAGAIQHLTGFFGQH